jgi:hypothetical protein
VLSLSTEEAYGLGKAKAKAAPKTKDASAVVAPAAPRGAVATIASKLPEWAWALIAIGGIAVIGGTTYLLVGRRGRNS